MGFTFLEIASSVDSQKGLLKNCYLFGNQKRVSGIGACSVGKINWILSVCQKDILSQKTTICKNKHISIQTKLFNFKLSDLYMTHGNLTFTLSMVKSVLRSITTHRAILRNTILFDKLMQTCIEFVRQGFPLLNNYHSHLAEKANKKDFEQMQWY